MASDLVGLLQRLAGSGVEHVVVGGMAGVLRGAPIVTADLDIVHRRTPENVRRLIALLRSVGARFRYDARDIFPSESHFLGRGHLLLVTDLGPLDVLCQVSEQGFEELVEAASPMSLGDDLTTLVIGLEKLIELKEAAGRPKDLMALPTLRATLHESSD